MENESFFTSQEEFEEARTKVQELTGWDIAEAKVSAGSRNITYVFSESVKPSVIRITPAWVKPVKVVYSELLFMDYLREHIHTICNPVPFRNKLINVIHIGENDYYVVVTRKANGISPEGKAFADPEVFTAYGRKLGELHAASAQSAREGFHFQRPDWLEAPGFTFEKPIEGAPFVIPEDVLEIMFRIRGRVEELPRTEQTFGMIHGDMSPINSFLDWDDVWFFDFDDSCYHYFMYDSCCFLIQAQKAALDAGAKFNPASLFREGYEKQFHLPEECWSQDYMQRFYNLRLASGLWLMQQSKTRSHIEKDKMISQYLFQVLRGMKDTI